MSNPKDITIRKFRVKQYSSNNQNEPISDQSEQEVQIAELSQSNYGYYIWPSALIMARFLFDHRNSLFNKDSFNIIEVFGAGTSLPSIIARKYCKFNHVIITDDLTKNKNLSALIQTTLKLNKLEEKVRMESLVWDRVDLDLLNTLPQIDIVIGSDVFFDSKYYEDLVAVISLLIGCYNPNLQFYTTYVVRSAKDHLYLFYLLCEKYALRFEELTYETNPNRHDSDFLDHLKTSNEILLIRIFK